MTVALWQKNKTQACEGGHENNGQCSKHFTQFADQPSLEFLLIVKHQFTKCSHLNYFFFISHNTNNFILHHKKTKQILRQLFYCYFLTCKDNACPIVLFVVWSYSNSRVQCEQCEQRVECPAICSFQSPHTLIILHRLLLFSHSTFHSCFIVTRHNLVCTTKTRRQIFMIVLFCFVS